MQQLRRLLLGRLDRHKPHRRARNRFANRFGIGGVVLVAFDVRLHILRRHQPHLMPKRAQLARPVMPRGTGFQPDQAGRNAAEERQHLSAPQSLPQNRPTRGINPVNLKNVLAQVQSDRRNLAHGWLPVPGDSPEHQLGTSMPQGGHPPHHSITSSARASSIGGISILRALAVLRLITRSNFVGCSTGKSDGLAPCKILCTYEAPRRNRSGRLAPYDMRPPATTFSRTWNIPGSRLYLEEIDNSRQVKLVEGIGGNDHPVGTFPHHRGERAVELLDISYR